MLTSSWLAVVCGCVAAVVANRDDGFRYAYQDAHQDRLEFAFDEPHRWGPPPRERPFPPSPPPEGHPPPHKRPPGAPHHPPKFPDKTIYEALRDDDRFSRVFKLIDFAEDVAAALNDPESNVTFFAVPDRALGPPHQRHEHKHVGDHRRSPFDEEGVESFFSNDVMKTTDKLELFAALESFVDNGVLATLDSDDDDDKDKERRKKILKKIVSAVLKYHTIGEQLHATDLARNTTFPSSLILGEGSLDGEELRLRIEQPKLIHPSLTLNFYARLIFADVETRNGIIHVLNHPLFPPPSTFQILFGFFDVFSTLSSAIQRVNLTDAVDWHWNWQSKTLDGSPAVTLFAPTNKAFHKLPTKLKLFLFSPFGERALKKILSYHVIPEYVFHSNWVHNASDSLLPENARTQATPSDDALLGAKHTYLEKVHDALLGNLGQLDDPINYPKPSRPETQGHIYPGIPYGPSCMSHLFNPGGPKCANGHRAPDSRRLAYPGAACHSLSPPPPPGRPFPVPDASRCGCSLPPPPPPPPFSGPGAEHHAFPPVPRCPCPPRFPPPPLFPAPSKDHFPWSPPHHPSTPHGPIFKPIFRVNATLPTLLGSNYSLNVHVAQFHSVFPHGYVTKVFVNGLPIVAADVPTRNGAIHVIDRLVKPIGHGKHKHGGDHDHDGRPPPPPEGPHTHEGPFDEFSDDEEVDHAWDDWEEWLPQWANEE
ncbi:FAS1 domain-containing protein [Irpex rosettiformis]|uniref:FAS1 domain-containing protein n=1 Tax=Irpex rosettiformis TaxID=378272 RepID=A0ACB8TTM2_9APHY|nr:FAS1 domain-containing protein [Irpex rosettiformis]